jgi:uncharacterized protein
MQAELEGIQDRIRAVLLAHNIRKAGLYGSRARGEHSPESDFDIVIESPKSFSLYDLIGLQQELSSALGIEAHVTTYRSLHPRMQVDILKDEVRLFG